MLKLNSFCNSNYIMFMMFGIILFLLSMVMMNFNLLMLLEYEIVSISSLMMIYVFYIDWNSLMCISFVMLISSMIIYYSQEYKEQELFNNQFIWLMLMFVFSMIFMIISPSMISIMLSWDGLGLISYCLVIYYNNNLSLNSGLMTIFMNRLGDFALLISSMLMMSLGSWNFFVYMNFYSKGFMMLLIYMMVIISGLTKSAQVPFSSCLPAAMMAHTPVSSLVHSSTLVTAVVYLVIRFMQMMKWIWFIILFF